MSTVETVIATVGTYSERDIYSSPGRLAKNGYIRDGSGGRGRDRGEDRIHSGCDRECGDGDQNLKYHT